MIGAEAANFPIIAHNNLYIARLVPYTDEYSNEWMVGDIQGEDFTGREHDRARLAGAVLASITVVAPYNRNKTTCTDSRFREGYADGTTGAEVAEQSVGGALVDTIRAAEEIDGIYSDPDAPQDKKVGYVADMLRANGVFVSTHESCGAATNLRAVVTNELLFAGRKGFSPRMAAVMPEGVYNRDVHDKSLAAISARLEAGAFQGDTAKIITDSVVAVNGLRAVERLRDDGRGVHGHVEAAITVLDKEIQAAAVSPNALSEATGGRQVFADNNSVAENVAQILSNGGQNEEAYVKAWHAIASFSSAGHGTLGNGFETWLISKQ